MTGQSKSLVAGTLSGTVVDPNAVAIGEMYAKVRISMINSVRFALELGERLLQKKKAVGHGEWMPWLKANEELLGFGQSAANKMMAQARKFVAATNLGDAEALQISRAMWGHDVGDRRTLGINNNEWYTPAEYVDLAREVMGDIDLDPASCEFAQRTVRARKFYTKEDDGLSKQWHGRIFLNPPYSRDLLFRFVDKLIAERNAKRVKAAILLTHNFSDTGWFQKAGMFCQAVCFTRGRISFVSQNLHQQDGAGPAYGQAFMYFGPDTGKFFDVFSSEVGLVLRP